jgi:hypothetical protein
MPSPPGTLERNPKDAETVTVALAELYRGIWSQQHFRGVGSSCHPRLPLERPEAGG